MSGYTIISDVTEAIIKILRAGMVPDVIPNTEGIGACHPSDRGDIVLGINLYDVKRNTDITANSVSVGTGQRRGPSLFLDLFYMITAYSTSDIKFRAIEDAKIIGRAVQLLEGNAVLSGDILGKSAAGLRYTPRLEFMDLDSEEKIRLWNIPDVPYKFSVFYKVYPVEIESVKISDVTRVVSADFTVEEKIP